MQPASTGEYAKKIDYLAAGTAALRRRVDSLTKSDLTESEDLSGDTRCGVVQEEVKRLQAELAPLLQVAREFGKKWEWHKEQLLVNKKSEIEAHLRREDEIAQARSDRDGEAELLAIAAQQEQKSGEAASMRIKDHEGTLRSLVDAWGRDVRGSDEVLPTDIDKTVQAALSRTATWTSDHEQRLINTWKEQLRRLVHDVHNLDFQTLVALEDSQAARRAVMEDMLQRQRKELMASHARMREEMTQAASELLDPEEKSSSLLRKRDDKAERRLALQIASRLAKARVDAAKAEAVDAQETHIKVARAKLESMAAQERRRQQFLQDAIDEIGPRLVQKLSEELDQKIEQLQTQNVRFEEPDPGQHVPAFGDAGANEDSQDLENGSTMRKVATLKANISGLLSGFSRGEWGEVEWQQDIQDASQDGASLLRQAEAALESQVGAFRKGQGNYVAQHDEKWLRGVVTNLTTSTKEYVDGLHECFERLQTVKLALNRDRRDKVLETCWNQERLAAEAETELLQSVSKLAHEAEAVKEVGHALRRGSERLPVAVVAACWRNAILASFPVLIRAWQTLRASPAVQNDFLARLLAVFARSGVTAGFLDQTPA
eukprot:TRINITY_DN89098_c0_g1_i1.p1 TRINITY_DN89098_c0_g1~~TRINITY_DN89098_c0_g1_i1.p1  ORF type:complete len:628 (+),score=153.03 TRINITY_DN89098_c0_g1_i1:81-1886(+)